MLIADLPNLPPHQPLFATVYDEAMRRNALRLLRPRGLQEKKAELAVSVLSDDRAALAKFGEADIRALLAPLPDKSASARRG